MGAELLHDSTEMLLVQLGYYDQGFNDDNFERTPERAAQWLESFKRRNVEQEIRDTLAPIFPEGHNELVIVKGITFAALCAHHLLPFTGTAHVGYIPSGAGVVGLSKIARAVKLAARQLTLQERITRLVADGIHNTLACQGVMVVLEATHMCMTIRGVEDDHTTTTTSAVRGVFATNDAGCKDEFLRLIAR